MLHTFQKNLADSIIISKEDFPIAHDRIYYWKFLEDGCQRGKKVT